MRLLVDRGGGDCVEAADADADDPYVWQPLKVSKPASAEETSGTRLLTRSPALSASGRSCYAGPEKDDSKLPKLVEVEMRPKIVNEDIQCYMDTVLDHDDNIKKFSLYLKNRIREAIAEANFQALRGGIGMVSALRAQQRSQLFKGVLTTVKVPDLIKAHTPPRRPCRL